MVLDEPTDSDDKLEVDGLNFVIDQQLSQTIGNVTIDFVDNGYSQGFTLSSANPLPGSSCSPSCSCG